MNVSLYQGAFITYWGAFSKALLTMLILREIADDQDQNEN